MSILSYNKYSFPKIKYKRKYSFVFFFILFILMPQDGLISAEVDWFHVEMDKRKEIGKDDRCYKCHLYIPDYETDIFKTLHPQYEKTCITCHGIIPQICKLITTPNIYKILLIQIPDFPLPLFNERLTCASCHFNHKKTEKLRLRDQYRLIEEIAKKRIDPHKTGAFCFLCHKKEPKEKELYLKYGKDTVKLCRQCHNNERARADNHPVNIKPSKDQGIKIPDEFPLSEGRLTCVTCHQLKCQGDKKNPYFLRGGPYKTRIQTCLTCHLREQYRKENPHDLISADGKITEDRCFICHSLDTDEKGQKVFGFRFKVPFRFYCVGCHPVEVQKHPFGANHTGRYVESIWAGMSIGQRLKMAYEQSFKISPVSISGQVMCSTCHNPHDPRPGPKLRINDINLSCRQCHYKHYGQKFSTSKRYYIPFNQPSQDDFSPKEEDRYPFGYKASIRFYCIGCHPNKEKKHPYGADHNGRFIKSFWKYLAYEKRIRLTQTDGSRNLPLTTNGQIACFTCHNPHDARKGYKLRLEERDILCALCHPDRSSIIEVFKAKKDKEEGIDNIIR